jgi:hypothetical protein
MRADLQYLALLKFDRRPCASKQLLPDSVHGPELPSELRQPKIEFLNLDAECRRLLLGRGGVAHAPAGRQWELLFQFPQAQDKMVPGGAQCIDLMMSRRR